MAENAVNVSIRENKGKGAARKLRAVGRIPGVCYGMKDAPTPIDLDPQQLREFNADGYEFVSDESHDDRLVFARLQPAPPR